LKHDLGIDSVVDVAFHNESGTHQFCVISLKNATTPQVWQALYGAVAIDPVSTKWIVAVNDDIDPRDMDSVIWALCFRVQPHRDMQVLQGKTAFLDPSAVPTEEQEKMVTRPATSSSLIDATRNWGYPPTALPRQEFMEKAREMWESEGLPPLKPKVPWYGSSLGYWPEEMAREAELALEGEYYQTGEKLARERTEI
jgi:4-hydroxy-3-polyprenylbenzoate decarboxylase